ncbi:DUF494 domain-containing protein [Curvibacter sp. APW13]|uniref:DUF494 family protein n=1 Tax=Curvibacter sp. APW13 TaxID=3077236 RepID=UPI0028DFEC54|nr:DUF494 domain-containing protein [Curvibacter sp. APW13]MDT8990116.1 DUF494 domain-containing protein [Curvibacter sp. APW13]
MFDVLAFVYQNYAAGDFCPEVHSLQRKLSAVGFDSDEIRDAVRWISGLSCAKDAAQHQQALRPPHPWSLRVYLPSEYRKLGSRSIGFLSFLESCGVLSTAMREVIVDRSMAAPGSPVSLDDFKLIVLMVFWSFNQVPDALLLDELCDNAEERLAH